MHFETAVAEAKIQNFQVKVIVNNRIKVQPLLDLEVNDAVNSIRASEIINLTAVIDAFFHHDYDMDVIAPVYLFMREYNKKCNDANLPEPEMCGMEVWRT